MPYIDLKTARLYYEDEGVGKETLVFGHSMLFNLRMFDEQVNFLKDEYRCVRFDFKGQGKSEITLNGYDLDTLTEETREFITRTDCAPCHFVGFSMGGMVALRLAIKYPEIIRSLILIDTSSEPEPRAHMLRNKLMLWVARYGGLRPLCGRVMKMFFGADFLQDQAKEDQRNQWKDHFLANDRTGIIKVVKGVLSRRGITGDLGKIQCPVLIMVGEKDKLTDEGKAELMHKMIPSSRLVRIPGAGHMSPVEEPEKVNTEIRNFLLNFKYHDNASGI
ncbi:alpha/beta fold hydrolase [Gramella sp. KN1008]|uniref:alpha/beta fold hydrolase n=1 Tax=Gramella sp. KN1008 TaxID=2529298 RepID=UPI00103D1B16|nr:alpha/beta hydrolase [Gramella sp. KN1008]TBW29984.1 alpha/beta hydrolase [Gramella sp. KN1008]